MQKLQESKLKHMAFAVKVVKGIGKGCVILGGKSRNEVSVDVHITKGKKGFKIFWKNQLNGLYWKEFLKECFRKKNLPL